jgi:hypothetical protein
MSAAREQGDQLSVTGDEGQYVQSTEGPAADTTVHTRQTPGIAPEVSPELVLRGKDATPDPELASLRRSVRSPAEVDRQRPRRIQPWSPVVTGLVAFALIVGIGTIGLLAFLQRDRSQEPVVAPAPGPTEIGGVPVRRGMKGGGE